MTKKKNSFDEFRKSLEKMDGNLHVLDSYIPMEKQLDFFRYSELIRPKFSQDEMENQLQILLQDDSSELEIKHALAFLSVSREIKAFRAIEMYAQKPDAKQTDWANLALLQAKIALESEFSDEKQIFISTGLGGRDNKLRFYAFFKSNQLNPFSDYQKQLIEKEFAYSIEKNDGVLEEITIKDIYFSLILLISIHEDIKNLLEATIAECNQYGDFIDKGFMITNVKIFDREDIQKRLLNRENKPEERE